MNKESKIKVIIFLIAATGILFGNCINQSKKYKPPKLVTAMGAAAKTEDITPWNYVEQLEKYPFKYNNVQLPLQGYYAPNNYNKLAVYYNGKTYIAYKNNIYVLNEDKFVHTETMGTHIYQLVPYDGMLFCQVGGKLQCADDLGRNWTSSYFNKELFEAEITVNNNLINFRFPHNGREYKRYFNYNPYGSNRWDFIIETKSLSDEEKRIITNNNNVIFRVKENPDNGRIHLTLPRCDEKIIGGFEIGRNPKSYAVTDNYVFYVADNENLPDNANRVIIRYDLKGENPTESCVPGALAKKTEVINYDNENIYIKDKENKRYFSVNQTTLHTELLPVEYKNGEDDGIVDGWMYRMDYDNPVRINIRTGQVQRINEMIQKQSVAAEDTEPSKIRYFVADLNNLTPQKYYRVADGWLMDYIGSEGELWKENGEYVGFQTHRSAEMFLGSDFDRKIMYACDYYSKDSTGYEDIPQEAIVATYNGKGNVFPAKVTYINYFQDRRRPKQQWINYFENWLEAEVGPNDSPMLIRESWSYTYKGKTVHVVNASNLLPRGYEEIIKPDIIPAGENFAAYNLTAIFVDGRKPGRLYDNYWLKTTAAPVDRRGGVGTSVTPPQGKYGDNGYAIPAFSFYLYDKDKNLIPCNYYSVHWTGDSWTNWIQDRYDTIVADVDFDGEVETVSVAVRGSLYSSSDEFEPRTGKLYYGKY